MHMLTEAHLSHHALYSGYSAQEWRSHRVFQLLWKAWMSPVRSVAELLSGWVCVR